MYTMSLFWNVCCIECPDTLLIRKKYVLMIIAISIASTMVSSQLKISLTTLFFMKCFFSGASGCAASSAGASSGIPQAGSSGSFA